MERSNGKKGENEVVSKDKREKEKDKRLNENIGKIYLYYSYIKLII